MPVFCRRTNRIRRSLKCVIGLTRWRTFLWCRTSCSGWKPARKPRRNSPRFCTELNHPNIGVNFDPANMILYDKGDPVKALHVLAPWMRQVHIKDAKRTKIPGTWGEEVAGRLRRGGLARRFFRR